MSNVEAEIISPTPLLVASWKAKIRSITSGGKCRSKDHWCSRRRTLLASPDPPKRPYDRRNTQCKRCSEGQISKRGHHQTSTSKQRNNKSYTISRCYRKQMHVATYIQTLENTEKTRKTPRQQRNWQFSWGNVHPFSIGSFVQKVSEFP